MSGPLTGNTYVVTDPGRALISGTCADIGKVKGPILRGLAGRAPYFHNGSAATLLDVVNFYNLRFNIGLTNAQMKDGRVPANPVTTNTYEGPEQRITFRSPHLTASLIRAQT